MGKNDKDYFNKANISAKNIKKQYGVDLFLFLDAVALGLRDEEISQLIGYDLEKVKKVRQILGNVGSEIGLNYKKNITP